MRPLSTLHLRASISSVPCRARLADAAPRTDRLRPCLHPEPPSASLLLLARPPAPSLTLPDRTRRSSSDVCARPSTQSGRLKPFVRRRSPSAPSALKLTTSRYHAENQIGVVRPSSSPVRSLELTPARTDRRVRRPLQAEHDPRHAPGPRPARQPRSCVSLLTLSSSRCSSS